MEENCDAKRAKYFCAKEFRQELKGCEALKGLKKFISECRKSDDLIFQYMESGGSIVEILSLIDKTAKLDLTTITPVFEAVHLILLRFQDPGSEYYQYCIEGAKQILNFHSSSIQQLLSMNTPKHKKAALKILTALVTLQSTFAIEILNLFTSFAISTDDLISPSAEKESVRKSFILFILSFLIHGNLTVLKTLMENKGFLGMIIPGLKFDDATTVNMTLTLIENKILKNERISKTSKIRTFNTKNVLYLFELYNWKGPQSLKTKFSEKNRKHKVVEVNEKDKALVVESVHSFLLLLCTSKKYGVAFSDKSLGTSEAKNNQLLLSVFEGLSNPLDNIHTAEIVFKTLTKCPDLIKSTLLKLEPFFQPRNSKSWLKAIELAVNFIQELNVVELLHSNKSVLSSSLLSKVIKTMCIPHVLASTAQSGVLSTQPLEVQLWSLRMLLAMYNSIRGVINAFKKLDLEFKKSTKDFILKFLPSASDIVELWQKLCSKEFSNSFSIDELSLFLSVVLDSLDMIFDCENLGELSLINVTSNLLFCINLIKDTIVEELFIEMQAKIVLFMEKGSYAPLIADMKLFQTSLSILLLSSKENSLSFGSKILSELKIFEKNKSEIDVWLLCFMDLPRDNQIVVMEGLIDSLCICYDSQLEKEIENEIEEIQKDNMAVKLKWKEKNEITTFVFYCIKTLKKYVENSKNDSSKVSFFHLYIRNVIINLQHWYPCENLYFLFKSFKKILGKSVLNYLKSWSTNSLSFANFDTCASSSHEQLEYWLNNDKDNRKIEEIFEQELNFLKSYQFFKTTVGFLVLKIQNNQLYDYDIEKYSNALSYLLKANCDFEYHANTALIFFGINNDSIYYTKCLECIFLNENFVKLFSAFTSKKNSVNCFSKICERVFMKNEKIKKAVGNTSLIDTWKNNFIRNLSKKIDKKKSINTIEGFENILNFFEYDHSEASDMLTLLTNESNFGVLFNNSISEAWIVVLIKFLKIYCDKKALSETVIKKLCLLMKNISDGNCFAAEIMDECFVFLLRKHPTHVLFCEADFINQILQRKNVNFFTIILAKLILNDPVKLNNFFTAAFENIGSGVLFPLLSTLLVKNDFFKSESLGITYVDLNIDSSEMSCLLKSIFNHYEENIINALKGEDESIILNNLVVTKILIDLFIDTNVIKLIKKNILKGKFHPELLLEVIKKTNKDVATEYYLKGLIVMFCQLLKASNVEENIWSKFDFLVTEVLKFNLKWESTKNSSEWTDFFKLALRLCLDTSKYPYLLKLMRSLINAFYSLEDDNEITILLFQMLISHSQFLNVILGKSLVKAELVKLYYALVVRSKREMSSKHIPVLLASYNASIGSADCVIIKILRFYEKSGFKFTDYEPLVWGEAAISHYSIKAPTGLSLWQHFTMANVLSLLDFQKLEISLEEFPIHRSLEIENETESICNNENVYDPSFLLPLFANLLSPGSIVFPLQFMYKGALAFTIRALSSECKDTRSAASVVLSRFYNHLELNQNLKQKLVWMHFINCIRYGIENLSLEPVSNIITLFLAKMTLELSQPPADLHVPLQNFLLAKSYFTYTTIPEFLPLFHSSEVSFITHKDWLLNVLKDGVKTNQDVKIIFYSMAIKVIFCFFQSQLCSIEMKKLILKVLENVIRIRKSILLISEYGILSWINTINFKVLPVILKELIHLLFNLVKAIIEDLTVYKAQHTSFSDVIQLLNVLMKLLPVVDVSKSVEVFNTYLKTVLNCLVLCNNNKKNDWFLVNKNKLQDIISVGRNILGYDLCEVIKVPFYFNDYDERFNIEVFQNFKNVTFLFNELIK